MALAAMLPAMSYPSYPSYPKGSPGLWLGLSIVSTLMCCPFLSVVGIIYAAKAMSEEHRGNYYAAEIATLSARRWTIASFLSVVLLLVAALVASALSRTSQFS